MTHASAGFASKDGGALVSKDGGALVPSNAAHTIVWQNSPYISFKSAHNIHPVAKLTHN